MALMTALRKIKDAHAAYKQAIDDLKVDGLVGALASVIPAGFALAWTQYTPSFNDGDPCRFGVDGAYIIDAAKSRGISASENGVYLSSYRAEHWDETERADYDEPFKSLTSEQITAMHEAWSAIGKDVLENVFGDGAFVIVRADGSHSVNEYGDY